VKRSRGADGKPRLWIDEEELELLLEGQLSVAGLLPSVSCPAIDIETFLESHLKVDFDPYAPLPADTLGETVFESGARPKVSINKDLTGAALDDDESAPGLLGRYRITVAHEGVHVILHRCLFDLNPAQRNLFASLDEGVETQGPILQRCLKRGVLHRGRGGDWREIQANMGMAMLLMPRSLFAAACQKEIASRSLGHLDAGSPQPHALATALAERFKVSRQAAAIRLDTLRLLGTPGQRELP
jgi:IrrE N-terminal-like domain